MTIETLIKMMAQLRDPKMGCPWDRAQTMKTIVPFTLEEAYELADAIEREDIPAIREEMGDLLFQVLFYSQLAKEEAWFTFDEVLTTLKTKLIERHPHVFNKPENLTLHELHHRWETHKKSKRIHKGEDAFLADIPNALPALSRAQKMQKRAATIGFDWGNPEGVLEKIREETAECEAALAEGNEANIHEEIGDLLFCCVSLARHVKQDAETLLRKANLKFERRLAAMEDLAKGDGKRLEDHNLEQLEALWTKVKRQRSDAQY